MSGGVISFFKPFRRLNIGLLLCMAALLVIGVFFISSATYMREGATRYLYLKQLTNWIPAGVVLHLVIARVPYRKWVDWSLFPYVITLLLLALVLMPGIGVVRFGARRWLFGFQPSEFAKFSILPALAFVLAASSIERGVSKLAVTMLVALIPAAMIARQPDLGTALVLAPTLGVMLFVSGVAPRALFGMFAAGVVAAALFLSLILAPEMLPLEDSTRARVERVSERIVYPHWRNRVLTYVFADRDPLGAGWCKRQSEIAVGSGGRYGKGYRKGTQNILGFLPRSVSSTDFIFSVIAEETGFAGSLALLGLYAGILGIILWIGFGARDGSGRLLCAGVGTMIFVHVFVNMGMAVKLVPITGLPLPLVSYGGSFTISTMALLGLVQSVAIHGRVDI